MADIKHFGVLGMKWGRRMARDGSVTTLRRGQRVPLMTTVRGKPVQVNRRAFSNKTRGVSKEALQKAKNWFESQKSTKQPVEQFIENLQNATKVTMVVAGAYVATKGAIALSKLLTDGHI